MSITIMNLSGAYENQTFYQQQDMEYTWVDCRDIPGTNCYCEEEAKGAIAARIAELPPEGIHFIDSGNYHYLTLQWISKIQEDFILVHFDNHPDLQAPSFGAITSCGGWLLEAVENCEHLQEVYMAGVDKILIDEVSPLPEHVYVGIEELLTSTDKQQAYDEKHGMLEEALPVYITIDKDVLTTENAVCDWSQGEMTLDELITALEGLFQRYRIIGVDICGEAKDIYHETSCEINNQTNAKLLEVLLSMQQ